VNPDDLSWAFLFLVVGALIIVVGVLVGMIVARRIDGFLAPRPPRRPDDTGSASDAPDPASDTDTQPVQEDQHP
jgi:hypothetical protein